MVATEPGDPNTSKRTRFGLYPVFSRASALGRDTSLSEPNMPCSRLTVNATTATTSTATITVQRRLIRLPTEIPCISGPFDNGRSARREARVFGRSKHLNGTVRYSRLDGKAYRQVAVVARYGKVFSVTRFDR